MENLNIKGMVRNHKLAKEISDTGWGTFVNFLAYKLENVGKKLIEIDRFFPSSKTCSNCLFQLDELNLSIREWTCPHCGTNHDREAAALWADRDENAAKNIRAEGIRLLSVLGTSTAAKGGDVRQRLGRKVSRGAIPIEFGSPRCTEGQRWVVHTSSGLTTNSCQFHQHIPRINHVGLA